MLYNSVSASPLKDGLAAYKKNGGLISSGILAMEGADGLDVYNPSVPFKLNGKTYIAARVEKRDSEDSVVRFFEQSGNSWHIVPSQILRLQDPFVTEIDGDLILGGVNVKIFPGRYEWKTDFYRLKSLYELEYRFSGPAQMKDIRLLQLPDKRIAVFSRPQGERMLEKYGCVAKIGFTVVNRFSDINAELIENAPFLEGQFLPDEWGGANQLYNLSNGLIGVIGHKSNHTFDASGKKHLHYYGMSFAVCPDSRKLTALKIIISADCFPPVPPKRKGLSDVVFLSGIERNTDGTATVYTGLSDTAIGRAVIDDPLREYEILLN